MLGDRPADERGQLLIITALALAIIFVGLALVLNSAIYTENLATRQTTDSVEVTTTLGGGEARIERAIRHVNRHNNSSHDEVNRAFDGVVDTISNSTTDQHAKRGAAYRLMVTDRTNGTHLEHTNSSKSFVSGGSDPGKGDWLLAGNVPQVRDHTVTVAREDLYTNSSGSDLDAFNDDAFYIRFDDGSATWEVYLFDDGENVTVVGGKATELDDDGDTLASLSTFDDGCRVTAGSAEQVEIDISAGTVGRADTATRTDCPGLEFAGKLTGDISISHHNADDATESRSGGTYELAIGTTDHEDQHFDDTTAESPHATQIIYDARVESHYSRDDITHSRVVRLHPGIEGYTS